MALSPIKRRALRMLASATPKGEICRKLDITGPTFVKWQAEPEFQQALLDLVDKHDEIMSENLLEGELAALKVVKEGLEATDSSGDPDWDVRTKCAFRLLDAAGRRGKPSEKSETTVIQRNQGAEELAAALRDPLVQAWLEKQQEFRSLPPVTPVPLSHYEVISVGDDAGASNEGEGTVPDTEDRPE